LSWTRKEVCIVSVVTLGLLVLALGVLELSLHALRPGPNQRDALLGWKLRGNLHREFSQSTLGGRLYSARVDTTADGLRVFGSNEKAPIRILVLGDSFTADPYAADKEMWYAKMVGKLARETQRPVANFYVLAGGGGGWGTYQNLLLSRTLSRTVKPDLFILQFSSGDFQNNLYEWERWSVVRSQYMRRPFARMNGDQPRYAQGALAYVYRSILGESRLLNRIDGLVGTMQAREYGGSTKPLPTEVMALYERDSIALTEKILSQLRAEYRDIPAIILNSDSEKTGPNRAWKDIAIKAGFIPLLTSAASVTSLKGVRRSDVINIDGSHFSDQGNLLFGTMIGAELAALDLPVLRKSAQ
jgi:hypothetical protein